MAYDLEEQEQLAELKAWWAKYGNLITGVLAIVLFAYAGWAYYNNNQRSDSLHASVMYEELGRSLVAKDAQRTNRIASDLQAKYASTSFASMGSLLAARAAFDANDLKNTKVHLEWVLKHGKDAELVALARLRLAGVLLDEKAYDDGLKQLAATFPTQFSAQVLDRKGDILLAQNKREDARSAYKQALAKTDDKNPMRQLIQIKLDALGGAA